MSSKQLMTALIVAVAGFGLGVGCGDDPEETENSATNNSTANNGGVACEFDTDCETDEACEASTCVGTCADDTECGAGEVCAQGINTELLVCQAGAANNTMTNNTNNSVDPVLLYNVRILSTASGDDACTITDPGPDIFGVGLEDISGSPLGWGETVWSNVTFDGNDHIDDTVLDGAAPGLDADNCPDQFDGNVLALGCDIDSWVIVRFLDGDGNPVGMVGDGSQQIRVYEFGAQCGGTVVDEYQVDVCEDTMASGEGDDSSCNVNLLQGGSAEATGTVSGF